MVLLRRCSPIAQKFVEFLRINLAPTQVFATALPNQPKQIQRDTHEKDPMLNETVDLRCTKVAEMISIRRNLYVIPLVM